MIPKFRAWHEQGFMLNIKAKSYEEAEKFCEEYMDDLFASGLFTDYEFIEEVE